MSQDFTTGELPAERTERRPPPRSVVRDLAWGLAAAGLSFFAFGIAFGLTNALFAELRGPAPEPIRKNGGAVDGPKLLSGFIGTLSCMAFPLVAAVVVTLRTPWWVGLGAGTVLGCSSAGLMYAGTDDLDASICVAIAAGWVGAGLSGGFISGLRRYYRI